MATVCRHLDQVVVTTTDTQVCEDCVQLGVVQESIQVNAPSTTVDATSTTIGATLDSATLSRLPVGRRFSDTLYLAPGVTTGGSNVTSFSAMSG